MVFGSHVTLQHYGTRLKPVNIWKKTTSDYKRSVHQAQLKKLNLENNLTNIIESGNFFKVRQTKPNQSLSLENHNTTWNESFIYTFYTPKKTYDTTMFSKRASKVRQLFHETPTLN